MSSKRLFRTRKCLYKFVAEKAEGFDWFASMRTFNKFGMIDKQGDTHRFYNLKKFLEKINSEFNCNFDVERSYNKGQHSMLFFSDNPVVEVKQPAYEQEALKLEDLEKLEDNSENRRVVQKYASDLGVKVKLSQKVENMILKIKESV